MHTSEIISLYNNILQDSATWVIETCTRLFALKTISLVCILLVLLLYCIYSINARIMDHVKLINAQQADCICLQGYKGNINRTSAD
jgi:hypothetical protein